LQPVEGFGNAAVLDAPGLPIEDAGPVPGLVSMLLPKAPEGPGGTEPDPAAPNVVPLLMPGLPGVALPGAGEEPDVPVELELATAPVLGVEGVLGDIGVLKVPLLLMPALPVVLAQGVPGAEVAGVCPKAMPARLANAVAAIAAVNFLVTAIMFETPEIAVARRPTARSEVDADSPGAFMADRVYLCHRAARQ